VLSFQEDRSHLSKYVKVLDLAAWPPDVYDVLTEELLARLDESLEVFVAARTSFWWVSQVMKQEVRSLLTVW
jgi:hypothetical protein